jgi:uncharacterized protein (TIGR02118 family)
MVQFAILFDEPADAPAFDAYYDEVHIPLVHRLPGLERVEVVRYSGGLDGTPAAYHQLTTLYFADAATMEAALGSPEGQATTEDVERFPGRPERVLMVGEVSPAD